MRLTPLPEELAAADLVAAVRGASVLVQASGNHDIDLLLPDGRTIGLEVTQSADSAEIEAWKQIQRQKVESYAALRRWWSVGLRPAARVDRAHRQVPSLLVDLERLGQTEHRWLNNPSGAPNADPEIAAVEARLVRSGVDHAASWPVQSEQPGGYSFVVHKDGGPFDEEDIVHAAAYELHKYDNLRKLSEMDADERHLFVWIDHTAGTPWAALRSMFNPLPRIQVPDFVTTVWVAARVADIAGAWVPGSPHSITPPSGWTRH